MVVLPHSASAAPAPCVAARADWRYLRAALFRLGKIISRIVRRLGGVHRIGEWCRSPGLGGRVRVGVTEWEAVVRLKG